MPLVTAVGVMGGVSIRAPAVLTGEGEDVPIALVAETRAATKSPLTREKGAAVKVVNGI